MAMPEMTERMTKDEEALMIDIGRHFDSRLQTLLSDTIDTCERVGMDHRQMVMLAMGVLLAHVIKASDALGHDEKEFMSICRLSHRKNAEDTYG